MLASGVSRGRTEQPVSTTTSSLPSVYESRYSRGQHAAPSHADSDGQVEQTDGEDATLAKSEESAGARAADDAQDWSDCGTESAASSDESGDTEKLPKSAKPGGQNRPEMQETQKHIASQLNPHATRDRLITTIAATVIALLLVFLLVDVRAYTDTTNKLLEEGPRMLTSVPLRGDGHVSAFTIVSADSTGYFPGIGVQVAKDGFRRSHVTPEVVGKTVAMSLSSSLYLVVSSDADGGTVSAAVVDSSVDTASKLSVTRKRFTFPLDHSNLLQVLPHGSQQHSGEWDVLFVYRRGTSLAFTSVSIRLDGKINVNIPTEYGSSASASNASFVLDERSVKATWLPGLPLRYVVAASGRYPSTSGGAQPPAVSLFHLVESSSSHHFSLLHTAASSLTLGGEVMDISSTGRLADSSTVSGQQLVILTGRSVVLAGIGAGYYVEYDVSPLTCEHGVLSRFYQGGTTDAPVQSTSRLIAACGGYDTHTIAVPQERTLAVEEAAHGREAVSACCNAGARSVPLFSDAVSASAHYVVYSEGAEGIQRVYAMRKVLLTAGSSFVSNPSRLPPDVVPSHHTIIGFAGQHLFTYDTIKSAVHIIHLEWVGGVRVVGITIETCKNLNTDECTLLVKGRLALQQHGLSAGYGLYPTVDGKLTTARDKASVVTNSVGQILSPEHAYVDFLLPKNS